MSMQPFTVSISTKFHCIVQSVRQFWDGFIVCLHSDLLVTFFIFYCVSMTWLECVFLSTCDKLLSSRYSRRCVSVAGGIRIEQSFDDESCSLVNDTCKYYRRYRYRYFLLKVLTIPDTNTLQHFPIKYRQYFYRYFLLL